MKKILLVNGSPRKNGNSDMALKTLAEKLPDCEVTNFTIREKNCRFCLGCGACQGKDTQTCVQDDDIKALLPVIDECDGIVIAAPVYNQQVTAMAKMFIERWYPFFKFGGKGMSNTSKYGKKRCACVQLFRQSAGCGKTVCGLDAEGLFADRRRGNTIAYLPRSFGQG